MMTDDQIAEMIDAKFMTLLDSASDSNKRISAVERQVAGRLTVAKFKKEMESLAEGIQDLVNAPLKRKIENESRRLSSDIADVKSVADLNVTNAEDVLLSATAYYGS